MDDVIAHFPKKDRPRVIRDVQKASRRDHDRAVARLTTRNGSQPRFVEDPPLIVHLDKTDHDLDEASSVLGDYRSTLSDDRRLLLDRFQILDVAHRVAGVGSVGTRCWIALLEASDHPGGDHIVLQVKEAQASVLEPYIGASTLGHHGRRVVAGQRLTQGASDIFLGWCEGPQTGRQYYVRQLWDLKGRSDLTTMNHRNLDYHGALCGSALARANIELPRTLRRVRPGARRVLRLLRPRNRARPHHPRRRHRRRPGRGSPRNLGVERPEDWRVRAPSLSCVHF